MVVLTKCGTLEDMSQIFFFKICLFAIVFMTLLPDLLNKTISLLSHSRVIIIEI